MIITTLQSIILSFLCIKLWANFKIVSIVGIYFVSVFSFVHTRFVLPNTTSTYTWKTKLISKILTLVYLNSKVRPYRWDYGNNIKKKRGSTYPESSESTNLHYKRILDSMLLHSKTVNIIYLLPNVIVNNRTDSLWPQ